mgnify:CR=1 FL=1
MQRAPGMSKLTDEKRAGNAAKAQPNEPLQRIAARVRFLLKPKGCIWAARAEGGRWAARR